MKIIDIAQFAVIAYHRTLTNVHVGIEEITNLPIRQWARLESGPTLVCFGDDCVLLRQPIGKSHVEIILSSLEESAVLISQDLPDPDTETAWMQIFETACYPNDLSDTPPSVSTVTIYRNHETNSVGGIILKLSTGSLLGFDASSYGGLTLFFDGQAATFRRNVVKALSLHEEVISKEAVL